jgi:uncharacterized coiled-coil DUF342 family protein
MTTEEIEHEIVNLQRQQQQGREMVEQGQEVIQQTTGAIKALRFVLARTAREARASDEQARKVESRSEMDNGRCVAHEDAHATD